MSNERMTGVVIKVARRRSNVTIVMILEKQVSDGKHNLHDSHDGQHDAHGRQQDLHDGQQELLDDLLDPALVGSNGGGGGLSWQQPEHLPVQQYQWAHEVFSKSPGIGSYGVYW
jgi:hypothetical protein